MNPAILSVATAVPPHVFSQDEIIEKMIAVLEVDQEKSDSLRKIYQNSAIERRHSVIDDFKKEPSQ